MSRSWTDQLKQTKENTTSYWNARSTKQKGLIIGTFLFLVTAFSTFIFLSSRPQYVPLYSGELTQREVGDIKAELDKQGYKNVQLSDKGSMLLVPRTDAADLVVSLASKGYPKDNKINYDVFSQNLSFGASDRQYNVLEREAMQNEIADVIKRVQGIKNANVILTIPKDSPFVRQDGDSKATASVMVEVEPGEKLNAQQIRALYTLVSRSVPNLPVENITIMNQYSETLALGDTDNGDSGLDQYDKQRKIRQDIEKDIQENLHNMLGTVMGPDKVIVQTFVKLNFDKVKTEEKKVEPTDKKNNGIAVSVEKISKTFQGKGAAAPGGTVGTGQTDIPQYSSGNSTGDSNYEELQNRINYEVNHINTEIVKSPYTIDDITINVGVEPPNPNDPTSLTPDVQANIQNIVSNVVRTALGHQNLTQNDINQRITIFPRTFAGKNNALQTQQSTTNWWMIGGGATAVLLIIGGVIWFIVNRRKKEEQQVESVLQVPKPIPPETDYFAEEEMSVENQLRKLLNQRPQDFSKVIKTWLHDEEV
jgi:flagellar M-ring protein FliF